MCSRTPAGVLSRTLAGVLTSVERIGFLKSDKRDRVTSLIFQALRLPEIVTLSLLEGKQA